MPRATIATSNPDTIEIEYETIGSPTDPPLLLVMGFTAQLIAWDDQLCQQLADRGRYVIRYDNRDCGLSTRFDGQSIEPMAVMQAQLQGDPLPPTPYTLSDMAADAVGLLDHLEIDAAHVVGASMGGMIAQMLAAEHPERVLSLVSIMSNTGSMWNGQPALRLYPALLRPPPRDREGYIDAMVLLFGTIGSSGFERDEEELRRLAGVSYDRGVNHRGTQRHLGAILATGDRASALRRIDAATLVIHGKADRLVRPSGGRATAKAIRGARLELIEGMGHDLPRQVWPQIIDGIVENAARGAGDVVPA